MDRHDEHAPGAPGAEPRWTSSRKSGVGTALSGESRVWFTLGEGILNEIYYPRIDCANTRDIGLLVSAADGFFSEEKCDTEHAIEPLAPGVPGYRLTNTCKQGRYRIAKTVFTDPRRSALLMRVRFEAKRGALAGYRIFVLAAPHVANRGADNHGWSGEFEDTPLLFAQRAHVSLALASSAGWKARSCGFVGASDGWQQVREHGRLVHEYPKASGGNIALTGEIDLGACGGEFTIVLGFGGAPSEAGHAARAALLSDFAETQREFVDGWRKFQATCRPPCAPRDAAMPLFRASMAMLRTHETKLFHGGVVASLSIPWGGAHGDRDLGGYHVVWPRDLVHAATAWLAVDRVEDAQQAMFYLMCVQKPDGHWAQNTWVDGTAHWKAEQGDETASFILLVGALRRRAKVGVIDPWPAVQRAAGFLLRRGPTTEQDRWEENRGYTSYTLATTIAALVVAAEFAEERGERDLASRCRSAADTWNASIERWLYVTDTPLAREVGVEGYYVRVAPPETRSPEDLHHLRVPLKNHRSPEAGTFAAWEITSPDVLGLVRYGLRRADDPRIRSTVRAIDATLRVETRSGPVWRRFNHDGYGEDERGDPFLGSGIGRGWPVLTGERAHYELARGDRREAERLMRAMLAQSQNHLLPEQTWDADDIPARGLFNGQPSGSALPLVWAHAELVTLLRSLRDGEVFDCPPETVARYALPNAREPDGGIGDAPRRPGRRSPAAVRSDRPRQKSGDFKPERVASEREHSTFRDTGAAD